MRKIIEGSIAIAHAVALCRPRVIPAYPITPSTHVPEELSKKLADYEFIPVEAEFSAISACIGASVAGARTFTATSSQGLALMHEALHNASGSRLPIVMFVANRALSGPLNIWCDWQDSFAQRDTGWLQLCCKNNQEAVDTLIQAFKIAEKTRFPVMVCAEGFYLTHEISPVDIPAQEEVDAYLPKFSPKFSLDCENPMTFGAFFPPAYYQNLKKIQNDEMISAIPQIAQAGGEFEKQFGRKQFPITEEYALAGAETVFVSMNALAENIEIVVDELRQNGEKAGLLRIKCFRPFPRQQIAQALKNAKKIIVLEKTFSPGEEGQLATETKAALLDGGLSPKALCAVCGLGGRDVKLEDIKSVYEKAKAGETGSLWL